MAQTGPPSGLSAVVETVDATANGPSSASMNMGMLRDVVLVRIATAGVAGVTRATVRFDLAPIVEHRLSIAEWRRCLDDLVFVLLTEGHVVTDRLRLTATELGQTAATRFLGMTIPARAEWSGVRDVLLVGRALGVEVDKTPRRRKLESARGLRGAILEQSFGLPATRTVTITGLREKLARKAAPVAAVPSAPVPSAPVQDGTTTIRSRRAVERLLRRPREFASDAALLAELAAEQVGAQETSVPSLRRAILRQLIGQPADEPGHAEPVGEPQAAPRKPRSRAGIRAVPPAEPGVPPCTTAPSAHAVEHERAAEAPVPSLDLAAFAATAVELARPCAEGWSGNKRAYIASVWERASRTRPDWGLTVDAFKSLLVEAHKAGHLTLAYADLRSKDTIDLVQASAVRDRNNEWHFVRIDD